jgi:guanylate cyclase
MKMGKKAMSILDVKDEEFYEGMGKAFVALTESQGFFQFIEHLGRELRDFFLNLDNLHDYLKFKFPRMKPPSFFVESENESCMSH